MGGLLHPRPKGRGFQKKTFFPITASAFHGLRAWEELVATEELFDVTADADDVEVPYFPVDEPMHPPRKTTTKRRATMPNFFEITEDHR
ncbi:hypothetical protein [Thermococcus sp.]|uniref:hypothetical protein n=1 Tax=Thermococcus sp. TaxID=35749 RepID=UPI002612AD3D|nr:hypothetical protein [Thermococcus sp.]